jgi:hypothetical protein
MRRERLTEKILDIKRSNGWSWKHITNKIGGVSPVLVCWQSYVLSIEPHFVSALYRRRQKHLAYFSWAVACLLLSTAKLVALTI